MIATDLSTRIRRRLRTARARARHRLGLAAGQPTDVTIDSRFRHPVDRESKAQLVRAYRDRFGNDAVGREVGEAARAANHRFAMLGHAMNHGATIAWGRDPVSGRDWQHGFSPDIVYRGAGRLGDIKLPWELNKHQYFFTLGKAAWLTDDAGLAGEIVAQIDDWIDANPYQRGIQWISALEIGARAIAWILAYPFYADACDDRFRRRLAASLAQHMRFVEQHLSTGAFANTHLVGEAAALVAGGLFLECRNRRRWLTTGMQLLEDAIRQQVTGDGVHAERSVAYHRFFLDHYYLIHALLSANRRAFTPSTLAALERMTTFLMQALFPDGTAPDFGDADDARGLWLYAGCQTEYRGLLALGAVMFQRGDFKYVAGGVGEEVLWLFGLDGIATFDAMKAHTPETASAAYSDGGYYVMRGGWSATDAVLVFDCGPLGFGAAGHGHADALSIQLHTDGYPFLVDSGTFSYNLDYSWRDAFRGTRAHNTVLVDGADQSRPGDRMSWMTTARAHAHRWVTTDCFDLADGEHDGYRRFPDPVTHRRVVAFLKPNLWVIWDQLLARERHEYEALLHVRPDCAVERHGDRFVLMSPRGQRMNVWAGDVASGAHVGILEGDLDERGAWFSPGYGEKAASRALVIQGTFDGPCSFVACLGGESARQPTVAHAPGAIAVRADCGGGGLQRLWYHTRSAQTITQDDLRAQAALLFVGSRGGRATAAYAYDCRQLSIDGLVHLHSDSGVDRLTIDENECELTTVGEQGSALRVEVRSGMRLVINGRQV